MSILKSDINYEVGKEYPFTVVAIHNDFCELQDESRFSVYLQHTNQLRLVRGQKITCKVLANTEKRPRIELVETEEANADEKVDANAVESILKVSVTSWNTRDFSRLLLMVEKDKPFEDECRTWVSTLNSAGCNLETVRHDITHFLEQSPFLSLCNPAEREFYQERLTVAIELLGYSIKANALLADDGASAFIDGMFEKLMSSGYVYHPQKNFNIMSCLFLADRQLMEDRMEKLFGIIRQWKVEIWGKEPFNSTLTKVTELYVNENIWSVDRVKDNGPLVGRLVQALTIQLLLMRTAGKETEPEYRLCLSRLCVISTYLYSVSPMKLLDLALSNLLNSSCQVPSYTLEETKEKAVPFRLSGMTAKPMETTSCYIHGKGKLVISKEGIALYTGSEDGCKPMIGGSLGLWRNLQVHADKRAVRALPPKAGIADCLHLWEDVELELFSNKTANAAKGSSRKPHKIYDKVDIVITRQDKDNPKLFHCRIDDETGGEGFIYMEDIITYGIDPEIRHFRSETGRNLVFEATILDKEDDLFHFSMQQNIKKWAEGYYAEGERMVCRIYADRPPRGVGKIPAVTKDGISAQLGGFDEVEETNFRKGDTVIATMQSEGPGTFHICAKVVEHCHMPEFYNSTAFHRLMQDYAYEDEETMTVEDRDLQQSDRILDAPHVREIIRMIDRMSSAESEYVNAYNYLGFARVLCLMIGWDEQASYYRGRMELIMMLHEFAINDMVNQQKLESMEQVNADVFKNNEMLRSKFLQLQTVSYMGKDDRDGDLWEIYTSQEGSIKNVASLVIAYNMVRRNNMSNLCTELQNRIKQTLRLRGYESNLKIYGTGTEDSRTEYKTSIVFPPDGNMRPNMQRQMRNIMKVIASFLNTYGGTLYIGVNDSGAGVGIENDLEDPLFHGDKDKYQRAVSDAVVREWGSLAATYVDLSFDHENEQKDVLAVTVRPCPDGVPYEGKWLVRIGSTKREMTEAEFRAFNIGSRLGGLASAAPAQEASPVPPIPPAGQQTATEKPAEKTTTAVSTLPSGEAIMTSRIRKNTFEEYEEDYRPHVACLKFLDKGKFCKVPAYDYDPGLLTLAVYDEETRGCLILGYDNGTVAKVPVDHLLDYEDYREYARSQKARLVFASIAHDGDALLTISRETKGKERTMVRLDSLSEVSESTLTGPGERIYKEGIGEVTGYEVIPHDMLEDAEVLMDKDERTLGMPVASSSEKLRRLLRQWHVEA